MCFHFIKILSGHSTGDRNVLNCKLHHFNFASIPKKMQLTKKRLIFEKCSFRFEKSCWCLWRSKLIEITDRRVSCKVQDSSINQNPPTLRNPLFFVMNFLCGAASFGISFVKLKQIKNEKMMRISDDEHLHKQ